MLADGKLYRKNYKICLGDNQKAKTSVKKILCLSASELWILGYILFL